MRTKELVHLMIATSMIKQDIEKRSLFSIRNVRGRISGEDDIGDDQWV